ncbi:MAG: UDP-N-acetylmuramate dehydrogenase [Smithella sp.]|jgi:UDP-N-acetylmuramate dehydrogenase|nr:UDP-N-acetylmuramate dehydrogenase [Smithella sp.]HNY95342.1 UDP-N-acetylmuramate dehydrogenase [Smithellaceae bacterium]HOH56228.1 UDP-N-acetylmuramate dehydrogenase [Smithellaceae bacterium]HOU56681.1 UDP-N-acetylmuramate dehydrogenase [Smithellaceae bacterium]HPY07259.1 UDP-N-acetylmuramate dehydrogenase [Smithellaceae bacterium]
MTGHLKISAALQGANVGKVWFDEPISRHASLKLGGRVDALVMPESEVQLAELVRRLKENHLPFLPVGNLTNILVRDGGYRGALISLRGLDRAVCAPAENGRFRIEAQAGAALGRIVGLAADHELTGLEFCAGIPGSVGGAVWMNAGAFGSEIKDVLVFADLIDGEGKKKTLRREEIAFAYRKSNLPANVILCAACFSLSKGHPAQIRDRMAEIVKWRQEKHPLQYPSAGSVFKNLPGMPAGRLIEELGLKGRRLGDVQISKKHANFMINKGQGTASDMLKLIRLVQETVQKERGFFLETEIVVIGEES